MAVKWAVANGNWSAGATWNDGVVPVDGDYVYCNGYTISFPTTINIGNGTITNELNPNTNRNGGKIQTTSGPCIITANLIADGEPIYLSGHLNNTISGNLTIKNTSYGIYRIGNSLNCTFNINGNVICEDAWIAYDQNATYTVNVNGNVVITNGIIPTKNPNIFTINGNLSANSYNLNVTTFTINGNLTANYCCIYGATCNIGGNIYYRSTNNTIGIEWQTLNLSNISEWRDISEPRSNPFIILTDANMNNRQQYPPEDEVKQGTEYVWGEKVGTYTPDYPPESVVLKDFEYGDSDDRKTGTMVQEVNVEVGCVTPEDVRKDVPLVGMGVVGTLVVPSVDDVREGVVFDNGSVGTLIVQGGGDRLRIADFGYYTNAQSDTYIVDLTEQDKPKFAVAEERILIEMFPDLDLDNIPDKYFDDLFVKYLKYRLIVEYYRTAGINSTFTPSEPTTEIVNYQNVRNEVWLNSANIYLKAWSKKFPESITKPQRILL